MIAKDLINDSFPPLKLSDSGLKAINWMEEFRLEHLPLVDSVNYIGLASEEDILKLSALDQPLANHNLPLIRPFVRYNQPVFEVVKLISKTNSLSFLFSMQQIITSDWLLCRIS